MVFAHSALNINLNDAIMYYDNKEIYSNDDTRVIYNNFILHADEIIFNKLTCSVSVKGNSKLEIINDVFIKLK